MPDGDGTLELAGVSAGYGELRVLHDFSLSVPAGTVEVVLGRNGVGKTTLLSTVSGLMRCRHGSIRLDGVELGRAPAYRRAHQGIVLVQEGKRIFHERSLLENVVLGTYTKKMSNAERRDYCLSLIGEFPALVGREHQVASGLSGGQQQMLALAQALAASPRVLLLDEPSAGLAPAIVADLLERVAALRDDGMTVLLVEQLAEQALTIADHVTVIDGGTTVASGGPSTFRSADWLREAYFGAATTPSGPGEGER